MALIARGLATRESAPDYIAQAGPKPGQRRAHLRAYLGTIPDYAESEIPGVKLSGVAQTGPAAKAGIQAGDIIVELAGKKIDNIYDYTYAIEALKIGQQVDVVVQRSGKRISLKITPGSRE
jgi:S1-C subfamily serine protease